MKRTARTSLRRWIRPLATLFVLLACSAGNVFAVPSFARKYQVSCATCHTAYPQLNAFGRLYRAKGYRMPGRDERFIRDPQVALGSPVADQLWPRGLISADLPGSSVASFLVTSNFNSYPDRTQGAKSEFDGVAEVALIIGGTIGKNWSFFGDIDLFEHGDPGEIGRLFVQYNQSLGFNVRVGQFEPRAVPISNHRRLIRTTGYLADVLPVAGAQNFFGFSPSQKGIETFGRFPGPGGKGEFEWSAGIVNGEPGGAFEALEDGPLGGLIETLEDAYSELGNHDFNDVKDVYASLDYEVWLAGSFTFGGYVYRGTSGFLLDPMDSSSFVEEGNSFRRYGARFRWEQTRGKWLVLGAVSFTRDRLDRPLLNEFESAIYTLDVEWLPFPWLIWAARAETVDPGEGASPIPDQFSRYTTELIFLPAANIKLTVGATRSSNDAPGLAPFDKRYRAGLVIAF